MLSISSVHSLWDCQQKYVFSEVQRITPKQPSVPLKLGSWLHLLLAAHYQGKQLKHPPEHTWQDAHSYLSKKFNATMDEKTLEKYGNLPERARRLMESYLYSYETLWAKDGWEEFETIAVEQAYETKTFSVTIDLLGKDRNGHYFLMEHKTGKAFPYNADMMMIEPQASLQIEAVRAHGYDVKYLVYNYLRSQEPSVPTFNKDGSIKKVFGKLPSTDYPTLLEEFNKQPGRSLTEDEMIFLDSLRQYDNNKFFKRVIVSRNTFVAGQARRWIEQSIPRAEALRADPESAIRQVTFRCSMCPYRDLCHAEIMGLNAEYIRQTRYEPRSDDRTWLKEGEDD